METRLDNNEATASVRAIIGTPQEIPNTGFSGWTIARLGALVAAAGAALVVVTRRRRSAPA